VGGDASTWRLPRLSTTLEKKAISFQGDFSPDLHSCRQASRRAHQAPGPVKTRGPPAL